MERYSNEAENLKERIALVETPNNVKVEPKLGYAISLISNIDRFILDAPVSLKIKLLGSMFPQKIEFDGNKYRTNEYNKVLDLIYQQTNELRVGEKENGESFSTFSVSVPRPGIEPGWVAPLVFETSASTDSAIWAHIFRFAVAKVCFFYLSTKFFVCFCFLIAPFCFNATILGIRLCDT